MTKKYYPRKYKRLYLQKRDLQIINYCLEQKFLTLEQIAARFFKPKTQTKHRLTTTYRRMLTLQKFGLAKFLPIYNSDKLVQATNLGALEISKKGVEPLNSIEGIDHQHYDHDRWITDVRILFELLGLVRRWEAERYLKAHFVRATRVPDARFTLKDGRWFALEVEIASKSRRRYERIFSHYADERFGSFDRVLYVCSSLPQLRSLVKQAAGYPWFYFCLYEELMTQKADTVFVNLLDEFQLKDLAKPACTENLEAS